jgi:hypothetical protein
MQWPVGLVCWRTRSSYCLLPIAHCVLFLKSRPAAEHLLGAAQILVERSHGLGEIAGVVAAPGGACLADNDAEPLRARLARHAVSLEPREREHPSRAAHVPLVRSGEERRIAIGAVLHRQDRRTMRLHGFEAAHDELEQAVAHALAGIERIQIVGDGAVERFLRAVHSLAQRGPVEFRQGPARGLRQFRQGDVAPRPIGSCREGGAGQIAAKRGIERNRHETFAENLSCFRNKARLGVWRQAARGGGE